ncbi:MAG: RNA polymerase sigma factor [Bacteroidetes bacterium]|nr:RNA polymerase sigma factor [Bacteroidota bacterium]
MTEGSSNDRKRRFMALFTPAQPRLQRFVLAMTRDSEVAKDIVGETVLIAFQRFDTLRDDKAFLSFLFTIATRVAHRRTRAGRFMADAAAVDFEQLFDRSTPGDVLADIRLLYDALHKLPEKQREAILLYEIGGFSTAEIREIQGGSLVGVRVRIARGRKRLAAMLGVSDGPLSGTPPNRELEEDGPFAAMGSGFETEFGIKR